MICFKVRMGTSPYIPPNDVNVVSISMWLVCVYNHTIHDMRTTVLSFINSLATNGLYNWSCLHIMKILFVLPRHVATTCCHVVVENDNWLIIRFLKNKTNFWLSIFYLFFRAIHSCIWPIIQSISIVRTLFKHRPLSLGVKGLS